jgi:hypothetical protein
VQKDFCNKICQLRTHAVQQIACLCGSLGGFHNSRQPDCEGRATARLALDRDVAAHHLTKAAADGEAKTSAAILARGGGGSLGKLLEQLGTRKSRLKPGEFLITSAKGLLQQNLPTADSRTAANEVHGLP